LSPNLKIFMKRILFMAAMVLSLSACDNTKLQLRAPAPESDKTASLKTAEKPDSLLADTIKKDSVVSR
jgi:hypothetical protein